MTRPARSVAREILRLPLGAGAPSSLGPAPVVVALVLVTAALAIALLPWPAPWIRGAVGLTLVALASQSARLFARRHLGRWGWIVVDEAGVRRAGQQGTDAVLASWRESFGVTVLATADRARFLLAFTTPHASRHVWARVVDERDGAAAPMLFERATTTAESDLIAADARASLSAASAEALLRAVLERSPRALERLYLSSVTGDPVALDAAELCVGTSRIDLTSPLEWRASIFQERGHHSASVCQATWVRQGDAEVVLVSPLPGDGSWMDRAAVQRAIGSTLGDVPRSIARDVRLMQATVAEPPPRELRCAVDRVFMLPIRRVLDRAPRLGHLREPPPRRKSPRSSHP